MRAALKGRAALRRGGAIGSLLFVMGTSCPQPREHVVRRIALAGKLDSGFVLPPAIELGGLTYQLPPRRRHWWSSVPPRPFCAGYEAYFDFQYPSEWKYGRDSLAVLPGPEIDLLVISGDRATATIYFSYTLVQRSPSGRYRAAVTLTPEERKGGSQLTQEADSLAGRMLTRAGTHAVLSADDTLQTDSQNAALVACERLRHTTH